MAIRSTSRGFVHATGLMFVLISLFYLIGQHVSEVVPLQRSLKLPADRESHSPPEDIQHVSDKPNHIPQDQGETSNAQPQRVSSMTSSPECDQFPNTEDIFVTMKTGATEMYEKLPIHLLTTLKCLNDFLIISDMNTQMGDHQIIDVLEDIDEAEVRENQQYALYQHIKLYERVGLDPKNLGDHSSGWDLDKYKYIPMLKKAWKRRQDAKWYVFYEADTAMNWSSMRSFLDMLNPEEPLFIGSPAYLDIEFAHGGSGYVISGAAMKRAVGDKPDLQELYGAEVKNFCCGDRVPANILRHEEINLTKAWPMLNGEGPISSDFGDRQWCQPVITMHHMSPFQISQFWSFQQSWKKSGQKRPILWMDVYDRFIHPYLEEELTNWTNSARNIVFEVGSEDFEKSPESSVERASIESPSQCKKLCDHHDDCLSWEHHGKTCSLGRSFTFGKLKPSENGQQWTSGWHLERIAQFREKMNNCSNGPDWTYTKAEPPLSA